MDKKHLFSRPKTSAISAFSAVKNSRLCVFYAFLWLKNPFNQRNLRLINDLRSTKDYVRKNKLFMQNKAKFRKVKLNVNKVLTKNYDQLDTWSIGKKQSQTNPNKAKFKKAKMNVTSYITKGYENNSSIRAPKKQSQTSKRQKPMQTSLPQRIMKKTLLLDPGKTNPNKAKQTRRRARGGPISAPLFGSAENYSDEREFLFDLYT